MSASRRRALTALTLAAALSALTALTLLTSAQAAPVQEQILWEHQQDDAGGPQFRYIAADPADGSLYVNNQANNRIDKFSAWGIFERAWGWDVVDTGPGDTVADEFEVCVPADGDVCKQGSTGSGADQLGGPIVTLAVDSAGDVYAADTGFERRVQKFSPQGEFLLSFGAGVNQGGGTPSTPGDVCTAEHLANGDVCGAGTEGTGPAEFTSTGGVMTGGIAIDGDDNVWVGDVGRIQRFDTGGVYQGEVATPGSEEISLLAAGPDGDLYAAFRESSVTNKPDIHRLDSDTGAEQVSFAVTNPTALAVAADGDVYAFDNFSNQSDTPDRVIRRFNPAGSEVQAVSDEPFSRAGGGAGDVNGLAANDVTGEGGIALYVTFTRRISFNAPYPGFVRAYFPPPDPDLFGSPPPVPPEIEDSWASSVLPDQAKLSASINPNFWEDTTYSVQYGPQACKDSGFAAGCLEAPASPKALNGGVTNKGVLGDVLIGGLEPETTYHYRFTAQSSGGGPAFGPERSFETPSELVPNTDCPNQGLRKGLAKRLPDCRAWEMVSPTDTNGGDVTVYGLDGFIPSEQSRAFDQSAPGGGKLAYSSSTVFAGAEGAPFSSTYIASRGASGWQTEAINPPMKGGTVAYHGPGYLAFSEDLATGWLEGTSREPLTDPGPIPGYRNLYRRDNATGTYTWLESTGEIPDFCSGPCPEGSKALYPELQGFSADQSQAVFRVNDLLAPNAVPGLYNQANGAAEPQLYHWSQGGGVRLISVLPDGTPYAGESSAGSAGRIGVIVGSPAANTSTLENAVSEDGSVVYWGPTPDSAGTNVGRLYVRINADQPQSAIASGECTEPAKACTLPVSEAVPTPAETQFWGATPDGGEAIFQTVGGSLYHYDLAEQETEFITSSVVGVAGASEDLSKIYLASTNVLTGTEENSAGDVAEGGEPNLYLYEDGDFTFIATLVAGEDDHVSESNNVAPGPLNPVPLRHLAQATDDGSHLAFVSAGALTGEDNLDQGSGEPVRQVFLYDAEAGKLRCASCSPTGARPDGADLRGAASTATWTAAWIPGSHRSLYQRRYLSEDGNRLFFNSLDRLVPNDINDSQDVYEWEAPGTGDCTTGSSTYSERNEGCVALISSGESPEDSEFVDASESGDDVFIRTSSSLVPEDSGLVSIYDARVGGGFEPAPPPPAGCQGDACQPPAEQPDPASPGSEGFEGAEDPQVPRDCRGLARKADKADKKADRAGRKAKRAGRKAKRASGKRARKLRKQAKRQRKQARKAKRKAGRLERRAERCRSGAATAHSHREGRWGL